MNLLNTIISLPFIWNNSHLLSPTQKFYKERIERRTKKREIERRTKKEKKEKEKELRGPWEPLERNNHQYPLNSVL